MWIIDAQCWKCEGNMKVAIIKSEDIGNRGSNVSGHESFSKEEIELARSKGVIIEQVHSHTRKEKYLANVCNCGAFAGQFYLFTEYFQLADVGNYEYKKINLG